ncbi:MAG TPA: sigma 54-interacting transcriptional regulator [Syntrophomonas sp.]|nr:sigma 54-interacting transcriptional regulator [Syntrophomonas sp.]
MDRQVFEGIKKFKLDFINDISLDPFSCPYLNSEVAASWDRSRKASVDPLTNLLNAEISTDMYHSALCRNEPLIKAADPVIEEFKSYIKALGYTIFLIDNTGIILRLLGNEPWTIAQQMQSGHRLLRTDEKISGTKAALLSLELGRPILLFGIEHYSVAYMDIIAAAAPIADRSGRVISSLTLTQHLPMDSQIPSGKSQHMLELTVSVASFIESQYKAKIDRTHGCCDSDIMETFMNWMDDGVITISSSGRILSFNRAGASLLSPDYAPMEGRLIQEFLEPNSRLMDVVQQGRLTMIKENVSVGKSKRTYTIDIKPVVNQDTKEMDIAILHLSSPKKITGAIHGGGGAAASYCFDNILGQSRAMQSAVELGRNFALSDENILITGESGTGKELFAQAIHNASHRSGAFIAVNCAAMPRELIESELFGYEGGSFTGADRNGRRGKIELAHNGTLFLDEIGDMPLSLQAALLRVIQDKLVMRIGGCSYTKVDFSLVAATNKDLFQAMEAKLFRQDLFFRLSVLTINLPSLRERLEDIEELCNYFLEKYSRKMGIETPILSYKALYALKNYHWPGNVRQLENAMIYALKTAKTRIIDTENLPLLVRGDFSMKQEVLSHTQEQKPLSMKGLEEAAIRDAMKKANNNVAQVAQMLNMHKSTLYRRLKAMNNV